MDNPKSPIEILELAIASYKENDLNATTISALAGAYNTHYPGAERIETRSGTAARADLATKMRDGSLKDLKPVVMSDTRFQSYKLLLQKNWPDKRYNKGNGRQSIGGATMGAATMRDRASQGFRTMVNLVSPSKDNGAEPPAAAMGPPSGVMGVPKKFTTFQSLFQVLHFFWVLKITQIDTLLNP